MIALKRTAPILTLLITVLGSAPVAPWPGPLAADQPSDKPRLADLPLGQWVALPPPAPHPGSGGDLRWVYDRSAGVFVMFGGDYVCGRSYCRTTWTYGLAENRWQLKIPDDAPKGFPAGRCQPGLAYDPVRNRTWMHGGVTSRSPETQRREGYVWGQLWEYSLEENRWVNHELPGLSDLDYAAWRRLYADPASGRLILLGPSRSTNLSAWTYAPGDRAWKTMRLSGDLPRGWRWGGGSLPMAYDTKRQRFLLFDTGGDKDTPYFTRTLLFDPVTGGFRAVGGLQPPYRKNHDLVYDEAADRVVMFGGAGRDGLLSDTWVFDLDLETWTQLTPPTSPEPRMQFAMAYDARNNVTALFGGSWYEGKAEPKPFRVWILRLKERHRP